MIIVSCRCRHFQSGEGPSRGLLRLDCETDGSSAALLKTMTTPCPLPAVMSARYPLDQQTCLLNISSFSGGGDTSFVWAHHPLSLARIRWAVPVAVEEEIIAPSRKDWGAPKKHEAAISVHTLERGGKMGKLLCTQHIFR